MRRGDAEQGVRWDREFESGFLLRRVSNKPRGYPCRGRLGSNSDGFAGKPRTERGTASASSEAESRPSSSVEKSGCERDRYAVDQPGPPEPHRGENARARRDFAGDRGQAF